MAAFVALLSSAAAAPSTAAEPFEATLDVSYDLGSPPADPNLNRLDVYAPTAASGGRAPIVVYVHGGSWRVGDKSNSILDKARLFTDAGYVFVSVNYRLSPDPPNSSNPSRVRFPAHPDDLGEALRWLRDNARGFGGDPSRLILVGHSAGAHLASLVSTRLAFVRAYGVDPSSIRGTVALDTATLDLTERADPATSPLSLSGLLSIWNAFGTPAENEAEGVWANASPQLHADRRDAPHFLVVQNRAARLAPNAALLDALELNPSDYLLAVDNTHRGINLALGDPGDRSGETDAVMAFVRAALAVDRAPKPRLQRKPRKRVRINRGKRRVEVGFRFDVADERARFECRIDRRRWRPCSSPRRYELGPGKHRFRARSKNRDGRSEVRNYRFRVKRR